MFWIVDYCYQVSRSRQIDGTDLQLYFISDPVVPFLSMQDNINQSFAITSSED